MNIKTVVLSQARFSFSRKHSETCGYSLLVNLQNDLSILLVSTEKYPGTLLFSDAQGHPLQQRITHYREQPCWKERAVLSLDMRKSDPDSKRTPQPQERALSLVSQREDSLHYRGAAGVVVRHHGSVGRAPPELYMPQTPWPLIFSEFFHTGGQRDGLSNSSTSIYTTV